MDEKKTQGGNRTIWMCLFSIGNAGYEMLFEFFKNFQNFFLTDICHLSTAFTGTLLSTVNICKALFTPVSGMIIDRDPFKARDKASPWIIGMPVFEGLLFATFSFLAWKGANMTAVIVILSLFHFFPVLLQNGYRAAIPLCASNQKEANFLTSGSTVMSNAGRVLAGIIGPLMMVKMSADGVTEDAQGFFWAVIACASISIIFYWISAVGVRKLVRADVVAKAAGKESKNKGMSFIEMVKQIFTDKNLLLLFVIGLGAFFRTFVVSPSAPYYFKYVAGNMMHFATFSTATNIAGILGVLAVPVAFRLLPDSKKTCMISLGMTVLCHLSLLLVGESTLGFIVAMTLGQFFYQFVSVSLLKMFVDACDFVELKQRKAGKVDIATSTAISLNFTSVMFAQVLGSYVRNYALKLAGYVGAETVASAALTKGLVTMLALWPAAFLLFGIIMFSFYKLDKKTMDGVHAELDPMRKAAGEKANG